MRHAAWLLLLVAAPCLGVSPAAEEFMKITAELEPVQCEKRKLRRWIAVAEAERKDQEVAGLRRRFAQIDADPKTSKLEKRLGQLEKRISNGKGGTVDPDDLAAINRQRVEAFYRCE